MSRPPITIRDPRVERSRSLVLGEAYRMLTEAGIGGFSMDEIVRRSGVAKTTIYRHWPSRSALLLEACSSLGSSIEPPDSGNPERDLVSLATAMASQLRSAPWPAILPSIIDAAERDPELAEVQANLIRQFTQPYVAVILREQVRGGLASDRNATEIVAAILGPLFYRRWFSKEPIEDAYVVGLVKLSLGGDCGDAPN